MQTPNTLNITVGTDVILNVTLEHEGVVLNPALIDNLQANLITGLGRKTPLETSTGIDYIVVNIPWVDGRLPGCYSLEITGSINDLAWSTVGKSIIRYTSATEIGRSTVDVDGDHYDVTMEVGYYFTDSPIEGVNVTVDDGVGTPSAVPSYVRRVLGIDFHNLKGNGIKSIEQTTTSTEDHGVNVVTITDDLDNATNVEIRNGGIGPQGIQGIPGESAVFDPTTGNIAVIEQTTGESITNPMSQKAVTDFCGSAVENINTLFQQENVALSWTDDKILRDDNGVVLIASKAGDSVTWVNVVGVQSVRFNASKDASGSGYMILWAFADASLNIIEESESYTSSTSVAFSTFEKNVPKGATRLYVMIKTSDKSNAKVTKTTFVAPPNVQATMDYVDGKRDALDVLDAMIVVDTVTPTFSPNSDSSGRVIGLENNKYSIQSNNIRNSVASVNVEGALKVNFNSSIVGGGKFTKTRWLFNDAGGNNVLHGETKSGASALGLQNVTLDVPNGASRLLISLQNTHVGNYGVVKLTKLNIPESSISKEETCDVENSAVKAFLSYKYNNNDYSFSWVGRLKAMNANYDLPVPIVIDTPVDAEAQSRTLLIADNATFVKAWEIELDLVSTTRNVYNLEPQKWYWWKVIKDEDSSNVLGYGRFFCEGQIRELMIGASYTEAQKYHTAIQNARDIGGWQADGGRMRYGVLFRGHELDSDGTEIITAAGKAELLRLGVGVELDLRGSSSKTSPIDETVDCVRIGADLWFHHLSIYQSQMSQVPLFVSAIRAIIKAAKANKAVYAHCQGGCDRTGALCWAIEGLCGVSENDLAHDFELSDRPRSDEYMSRKNGDARDSDYKFAMDYVKGLVRYNNHIYTKSRCYDDTFITIGGVDYKRSTYEVVEGVKYFRWYDNANDVVYCTTDVYPTTYSKVYDETYAETSSVITKAADKFWYDCQSPTHGLSASRITDASLIASLNLAPKPNTLKEKFALLMQIDANNALGDEEIEELRQIFVS